MHRLIYLGLLLFVCSQACAQKNKNAIMDSLLQSRNNQKRLAIIFQMAGMDETAIPLTAQQDVKKILLKWYRDQPDAGLHSAIDFLFRHAATGEKPRQINWNMAAALDEADQQLYRQRQGTRNWFLTIQNQTMSVIHGPVTYQMGSAIGEKYRTPDELQHTISIPRSYAVSTKEITVAQFQLFIAANPSYIQLAAKDSSKFPSVTNKRLLLFSPDKDCPQIFVTWYEAAMYCNWLSKLEGIPETEWCYSANGFLQSGMEISKDYLHKKGYRLPTEAEWEYAARAGTATSHFFGDDDELLPEFAWYSKNPPQKATDRADPNDPTHTWPVGELKPNPFGLFDVYGNVWEWCDSRRAPYPAKKSIDEAGSTFIVTDSIAFVRRGGSYAYGSETTRSAHRGAINYFPNQRRDGVGFRIAKTIQ